MIPSNLEKHIHHQEPGIVLLHGDCREIVPQLEPDSIQCCVTSPPYWGLRDYGVEG
jgi:DNA modification methylase